MVAAQAIHALQAVIPEDGKKKFSFVSMAERRRIMYDMTYDIPIGSSRKAPSRSSSCRHAAPGRHAAQADLAPVVEGVIRGHVLRGMGTVGVAVALHHTPLHVGGLVLGQGRLASTETLRVVTLLMRAQPAVEQRTPPPPTHPHTHTHQGCHFVILKKKTQHTRKCSPIAQRHQCKENEDSADSGHQHDHHDDGVGVGLLDYIGLVPNGYEITSLLHSQEACISVTTPQLQPGLPNVMPSDGLIVPAATMVDETFRGSRGKDGEREKEREKAGFSTHI